MLIRPGECTQCKAQYHLPADFTQPLVKCRQCSGAVRVGEPQEVAELVAVDDSAASGAVASSAAGAAGADTATSSPAPTIGEAAAQLASVALDEITHVGEEIDAAIDSIEKSAGPASTNAFAIAGHADSPAARIIKDADAVEARVEEIEEELELLDLDEEELPTTSHANPSAPTTAWSPAALERSSGTLDPQPSRRQGSTLERLKAERASGAAPAAAVATSSASPSAARPSTLERLKAERAAAAASPSTAAPASTETPRASTLERLKAERAAAAATTTAPAPAVVETAKPARGGRRPRNEERERPSTFSREERRKRTQRNSLIGLAVIALCAGGSFAAWKAGYFDAAPAPVVAPVPVDVAPTSEPMFDSNFLFGEVPAPTTTEPAPTDKPDTPSELAPSLEDAARDKLEENNQEEEEPDDQP